MVYEYFPNLVTSDARNLQQLLWNWKKVTPLLSENRLQQNSSNALLMLFFSYVNICWQAYIFLMQKHVKDNYVNKWKMKWNLNNLPGLQIQSPVVCRQLEEFLQLHLNLQFLPNHPSEHFVLQLKWMNRVKFWHVIGILIGEEYSEISFFGSPV